jgi:hypothetical protein
MHGGEHPEEVEREDELVEKGCFLKGRLCDPTCRAYDHDIDVKCRFLSSIISISDSMAKISQLPGQIQHVIESRWATRG